MVDLSAFRAVDTMLEAGCASTVTLNDDGRLDSEVTQNAQMVRVAQ